MFWKLQVPDTSSNVAKVSNYNQTVAALQGPAAEIVQVSKDLTASPPAAVGYLISLPLHLQSSHLQEAMCLQGSQGTLYEGGCGWGSEGCDVESDRGGRQSGHCTGVCGWAYTMSDTARVGERCTKELSMRYQCVISDDVSVV